MANTIKLKNSAVAAKTPLLTDLAYGEVALNYADGKIYYKRSDNTIQSISGGGSTWTKITTATTATTGQQLLATSTVSTLTLPATPVAGNSVMVMDAGSWSATNLTIARNGSTIEGLAEDLVCNVSGTIVTLVYDGTTWQVVANVGAQGPQGPAGSGTAVLTDTVASWAVVSTFTGVGNPAEIFFKPDGLKMFLLTGTTLNQYTLSTAWDSTTASGATTFTITWDTANNGLFISPDGTKLITCGTVAVVNAGLGIVAADDRIYYSTLSTAWDITTPTLVSSLRLAIGDANPLATGGIPAAMTSPQAVHFNSTGTIMYVQDSTTDYVNQFSLSTAYNVSTAQWIKRFSVAAVESGCTGLRFNAAGTRMYITGSTNDVIAEYRLGTAWDIATAVFYDKISINLSESTPTGLFLDETSGNAYLVGTSNDKVTRLATNSDGILLAPTLTTGRIDLAGETRIKDAGLLVENNLVVDGSTNLTGALTGAAATFSGSFTLSHATGATSVNAGQTTGTIVIGGTAATGLITLGQSTAAQTLNIATGATATATTKTLNIGTAGLSGSTTNINIGSGVAGATSATTVNGALAVKTTTATDVNINSWSDAYSRFGPTSVDGPALGIGYNTTDDRSEIVSVDPGFLWKPLRIFSSGAEFHTQSGVEGLRITTNDSAPNVVSMALRLAANNTPANSSIVAMGLGVQNDGFSKGGIGWVRGTVGSDTGSLTFYNNGTNDTSNFATSDEKMRITSTGAISFGASGTAYGTAGQVLKSNGNATPTWTTFSGVSTGKAIAMAMIFGG